jgi:uncharacterized delta-60 repeat protein
MVPGGAVESRIAIRTTRRTMKRTFIFGLTLALAACASSENDAQRSSEVVEEAHLALCSAAGDPDLQVVPDYNVYEYLYDAVVSNGKILALGAHAAIWGTYTRSFHLVQFNGDGTVDTSFGSGDGEVDIPFGSQLELQPSGDIIVGGSLTSTGPCSGGDGGQCNFVVSRYTASGVLDTNFGYGGKAVIDFGASKDDTMHDMVIQPDGKIVAVGYTRDSSSYTYRIAIARYTANGWPDTGFGNAGKVEVEFGSYSYAQAVELQSDGKIVVVGRTTDDYGNDDLAIVRLESDGDLDPTFGPQQDGKVSTNLGYDREWATAVAIQSDGMILVAGSSEEPWYGGLIHVILRYDSTGVMDTSFGTWGYAESLSYGIHDIDVLSDDTFVGAGGHYLDGSGPDYSGMAVARYDADGALDASFGGDGVVTSSLGVGGEFALSLVTLPDGRLAVVGVSYNEDDSASDSVLAAFCP